MPSIEHEAPLVVLREEPDLVPTLLREVLGVELPPFATAEVADGALTQPQPAELRADLVVHLATAARRTVLGVIIEVQRAIDERKRRSWPLYAASLHARLGCQICLVVLSGDEGVARWAATAIETVQVGSRFAPLVIGPAEMPRLSVEAAAASPWLALLSAIVHGNRPDAVPVIRAAAAALNAIPEDPRQKCYDLIRATLEPAPRAILEQEMHFEKYEYRMPENRKAFSEGREEGALAALRDVVITLVGRHGDVPESLRAHVDACGEVERLRALVADLAGAADREAAHAIVARLASATTGG